MNNALAILFVLAILLALSLGLIRALGQAQLKLGYNATAASLYKSVNEYVGQNCASNQPLSFQDRIEYRAAASCPGLGTVPTLVRFSAGTRLYNVCAAPGEPGHLDAGVIDLHGATLEVRVTEVSSTPSLMLRLLHGGNTDARGFLAHLASGHGVWLPYDEDGDGVPEGVQRALQTRVSVTGGLWLAANWLDAGCGRWVFAGQIFDNPSSRSHMENNTWSVACDGVTRTVRDDKDHSPCVAGSADCYYPFGHSTAAETWNYGNARLREDLKPTHCCRYVSGTWDCDT